MTMMAYPLTVTSVGLAGKGVIAEGLTVTLQIPADAQVVAATGTGYQGVHADDKAKAVLEAKAEDTSDNSPGSPGRNRLLMSRFMTARADGPV